MVCHYFPIHRKTGFGILSLVLFFALFFSFYLNTNNSFATDYTYNIVNDTDTLICKSSASSSGSVPLCSDLKTVTFISDSLFTGSIRPSFGYDNSSLRDCSSFGNSNLNLPFSASKSVSLVDLSGVCSIRFGSTYSLSSSTNQWTVIVSTELPGDSDCPVCEECEVCPAIPDNPYDDKFDRIIVSIYTVGGILLFIYFLFTIYNMIFNRLRSK